MAREEDEARGIPLIQREGNTLYYLLARAFFIEGAPSRYYPSHHQLQGWEFKSVHSGTEKFQIAEIRAYIPRPPLPSPPAASLSKGIEKFQTSKFLFQVAGE